MANEQEKTPWERIQTALSERGLKPTQDTVAKILRIKQPSVSEWKSRGSAPKLDHAIALATKLNVCVEWIYTGRPPKHPAPPAEPIAQQLWSLWPRLDDDTKQQILGHAQLSARPTSLPGKAKR